MSKCFLDYMININCDPDMLKNPNCSKAMNVKQGSKFGDVSIWVEKYRRE